MKFIYLASVISILFSVTAAPVYAESHVPGQLKNGSKLSADQVSLAQKLKEWEKVYHVYFFYENNLVSGKKVPRISTYPSIQDALQETLPALNLTFNELKAGYYVIKSVPHTDKPVAAIQTPDSVSVVASASAEFAGYKVSGSVTDKSGKPVTSATVTISGEGINKSTMTSEEGNFSFENVANGNYLVNCSHVGYEGVAKNISVDGKDLVVMLGLESANNSLKDVVIIGYGTQKKKDITGSISVLSSAVLDDRPNTQFGYAIEGKAAGVQVIRSSGQPQAGFSIRIRGTSTITSGSEPLYIVDGVPTASINEINPADIETFSFLKDASAAAIYGASGANGVVLITTRRGKNQPTQTRLEAYYGVSSVWKKQATLNSAQYKSLMEDMGQSLNWADYNANTDWQHELFRTAGQQNYQLSVTGGNEKTGFYLSGGWTKQDGIVISNTMNRANFKLNVDHKISQIFKVGTSISYNRWYDVDVSENSRNGVVMNSLLGSPIIKVWDSTNSQYTTDPFRNDLDNPVGLASGVQHNWTNLRFNGNVYVEANILPSLKFRSMFGYEQYHGVYNSYADPYKTSSGRSFNGQASLSSSDNQYWISENTLTYTQMFGKNSITVLGGFISSKTSTDGSNISKHNFANPDIATVNGGSIIDAATGSTSAITTASLIGRITYDYDGRYLLTGSIRDDASSVFGPANRWGLFPSFSAGWRISKEAFFNVPAINELKLRGSWGNVGNSQIPAYSYLGTVSPSGTYVIGDHVVAGYLPNTLGNPGLEWETTSQTDFGLDIDLFKSRLSFTFDYYNKKTTGLLLNTPVPASSGYTTALKNIGDLQNQGYEFTVDYRILTGVFQWSANVNLSINKNKIISIADGTIYDGPIDERGNSSIAKAGVALGTFYGYVAQGVDPQTGNMKYKMADSTQGLQSSDQQIIGNANPKFIYGFTNNFKYKQWSLNIFFQGVEGNDILNATRIYSEGMWEPRNQTTAVLRRWTTPGQNTNIPRQDLTNNTTPYANYNSLISTRFVENGSYLRLKSLSLAYEISPNSLKKFKIARVKFYITAENLLTFTKYSGYDPEVSAFSATSAGAQSNNVAPGVDFGTYPQTRDIIGGLSVTF